MKASYVLTAIVVVLAIAGFATFVSRGGTSGPSPVSGEAAASSTVAQFGKVLQQVSIVAPDASSTIAQVYAPYVEPSLLAQWEADPESAPGRVVSSPWPDHIRIDSIAPQGSGYAVQGALVFMTSQQVESGGEQGEVPIVVQVIPEGSTWLIAAFQEAGSSTSP